MRVGWPQDSPGARAALRALDPDEDELIAARGFLRINVRHVSAAASRGTLGAFNGLFGFGEFWHRVRETGQAEDRCYRGPAGRSI